MKLESREGSLTLLESGPWLLLGWGPEKSEEGVTSWVVTAFSLSVRGTEVHSFAEDSTNWTAGQVDTETFPPLETFNGLEAEGSEGHEAS